MIACNSTGAYEDLSGIPDEVIYTRYTMPDGMISLTTRSDLRVGGVPCKATGEHGRALLFYPSGKLRFAQLFELYSRNDITFTEHISFYEDGQVQCGIPEEPGAFGGHRYARDAFLCFHPDGALQQFRNAAEFRYKDFIFYPGSDITLDPTGGITEVTVYAEGAVHLRKPLGSCVIVLNSDSSLKEIKKIPSGSVY